jgi:hypothetical protein
MFLSEPARELIVDSLIGNDEMVSDWRKVLEQVPPWSLAMVSKGGEAARHLLVHPGFVRGEFGVAIN